MESWNLNNWMNSVGFKAKEIFDWIYRRKFISSSWQGTFFTSFFFVDKFLSRQTYQSICLTFSLSFLLQWIKLLNLFISYKNCTFPNLFYACNFRTFNVKVEFLYDQGWIRRSHRRQFPTHAHFITSFCVSAPS